MKRTFLVICLVLSASLAALVWLSRRQADARGGVLTVYCAAGLKQAVEAAAADYQRECGTRVELQFGGTGTLLSQIRAAKRGDLFVAADGGTLADARKTDVIREVLPILCQHPVIAVRTGNPKRILTLDDLLRADVRVALANPEAASIGRATQAALGTRWADLASHATVMKPTVTELASDLSLGTVDAAILWDATVGQFAGLEGIEVPEFFAGKNIVHLPTVKCHVYTTTTGAMKNAFGGLLHTRRHYTHSWIHETLVDLLAIQKELHPGLFAFMDGTICGNGPGPRTLIPVEKDYILASADQVAIDAVAAKMMGFDPLRIGYIRMAHDDGLGCGDPRDIEVVGEDLSNVNFHFHVGDNLASLVGDACWFGPLKGIQKLLFRTPLVYLFVFASYFYHDYLWWPLKGRRVQQALAKTSQWAKLFSEYDGDAKI